MDIKDKEIPKFEIEIDKNFDLYTHMKINIKTSSPQCEIHDSVYTHYCISCKKPVCEICKEMFHNSHSLQIKSAISFDADNVASLYARVEDLLLNTRVFANPEQYKKEIRGGVIEDFEIIGNLLKDLKERKLREIDNLFANTGNINKILKIIRNGKKTITEHFNKHSTFFYHEDEGSRSAIAGGK